MRYLFFRREDRSLRDFTKATVIMCTWAFSIGKAYHNCTKFPLGAENLHFNFGWPILNPKLKCVEDFSGRWFIGWILVFLVIESILLGVQCEIYILSMPSPDLFLDTRRKRPCSWVTEQTKSSNRGGKEDIRKWVPRENV